MSERGTRGAQAGTADKPGRQGDLDATLTQLYPGGVPNIYRRLRRNPAVMAGLAKFKQEIAHGNLTEAERGLVALEVARHADCDYCTGALRSYLSTEVGVPADMFCATADDLPRDARAQLVIRAARSVIATKGRLPRHEIGRFGDLGLSLEDLIEIIAVVGEYTIATYAANLDRTRLDPEYRAPAPGMRLRAYRAHSHSRDTL